MDLFLLYSHHDGQPQSICKFSASVEDGEFSDTVGGQDGELSDTLGGQDGELSDTIGEQDGKLSDTIGGQDGELSGTVGGQDGGPRVHGKSMAKEIMYVNAVGGACLCKYICLSVGTIQHEIRITVNNNK